MLIPVLRTRDIPFASFEDLKINLEYEKILTYYSQCNF